MAVLTLAAALPASKSPQIQTARRLFVIVPAHNEARLISACVGSILAHSPSQVEVWVIAHNCTDATAENARAAGANVLVLNGEGGKGRALDHGFAHAQNTDADAVLVIDADSTVSPNLIATVLSRLAGGAKALQCRYQVANASATTRIRLMELAFLGMNILRPRGRDRLGLSCGIFGNGFALAMETLARVPYTANSLVEDLEYHLLLIRAGVRVQFVDDAAVYGEMPESSPAAATQRARWEGGRILMRQQWTAPLVREVLRGKLRMIEPLLDIVAVPLATEVILLIAAALVPVGWVRGYGIAGIVAVAAYLIVAALLGPTPVSTLGALLATPGYVVWKLAMIPATRRAANKDAAWVRTRRNDEAQDEPKI